MTTSPPVTASAASLARRVGAFAIDLGVAYGIGAVLIGIVLGIVSGIGPGSDAGTLALTIVLSFLGVGAALFAWWLVYSAMQGGRGSIGQRTLGLRLQDETAAAPIGFWRAVCRNIVFGLTGSIAVGYFTPLFDSSGRRQGWHDMAARAVVVDARAGAAVDWAAAPVTDNPYLPWPGYAASTPSAPPQVRPAVPTPRLPNPSDAGVVDGVPWVTGDPSRSARVRAPEPADAFPSVTMPFPAATTTEPLGAMAATAIVVAPAPAVAHLGHTVAAPVVAHPGHAAAAPVGIDDIDATRIVVPPPALRAALYDGAPVLAVLTWDDGTRMAVYGRTLYGRNPAGEEGAVAIPVRDETLSLSKTHFEVGGAMGAPWIVDRHSTNGTTLVRDGGRIPLAPGVRTTLRAGDGLEFGDRRVSVGGV